MDLTIEKKRSYNTQGFEWTVYEWGVYPHSSVLAGQTRKTFMDAFDTLEEALAAYPDAQALDGPSHKPSNGLGPAPEPWFDPAAAGESWDEY